MNPLVDFLARAFAKLRVCDCVKKRKLKTQRETYIPLRCMDTQQARWGDDYIPNDRYKHIRGLERGFEGFCILSKSKRTGKLIVMKYIPIKKNTLAKEAKMLLEEIRPHPNIVRVFAAQRAPALYRHMVIHMENCSGGDLIDQLSHFRELKKDTPPLFAAHVFIGLTNALTYLHHGVWRVDSVPSCPSRQILGHEAILHCDIKPDNVLLRWRRDPVCGMPDIVLADFGAAQFQDSSWGCDGGTYDYLSPEARAVVDLYDDKEAYAKANNTKILTAKSDMYSLGVLMYLVAAWGHWKCGEDAQNIKLPYAYSGILQEDEDRSEPPPTFIHSFLFALRWCLEPRPEERPECSYDKQHGLLMSMDTLKRRRDRIFNEEGDLLKGVWNMNFTHAEREDEETPSQRHEAMRTGKRSKGVSPVDSLMTPLRRVRANPH